MVSHNTKKALTIAGAGLATLAGSSVLSSNVSADTVAPDTTNVTNTTTDTPQAQHEAALKTLDEAKDKDEQATQALNDAKKEADQAQANKDQAQDAVNQQQGQVDQAQKDTNQAQETVNKAQDDVAKAQENAKDATPENIANTEKAIKDQQDKIQQDATAVDQATQAVRDANQNVDQAQQTADQAQTNVNDKQSATDKAQQDLDKANEALADNDVEKAQNDYNQAQANTKQAQQDDANAKQAVTDTQNALEQANQKVNDALNTATEAQKTADNAQADYDAKNQAVNQSQQKVNKDLADIKAVEEAMANQNVINLPDGYVDAFKDFYGTDISDDSNLIELGKKGLALNEYHASEADKNRKVVFSPDQPLSDDIELELTQFAAQLLNPIVAQFSNPGYTINGGSLAFAKEVSKRYDADKWNLYDGKWHDTVAINGAAKDLGLRYNPKMNTNAYEDIEGGDFHSDPKTITTTMAELKYWVYETITGMLFEDGSDNNNAWGHTASLLQLNPTANKSNPFDLGVMIDSMGQKHILIVNKDNYAENPYSNADPNGRYAQLAQTTYAVPDSNKLAEQKAQLQTQLKADQTDLGSKQQVASEALTVKQQADKDLATANQNLATARTSQQQAQQAASAAKTTADQAAQALTTATNNEQAAKEKLAAVSADEATKQEAVNQAQVALKAAQDELAQAQQDLAAKQTALKDAQNDLATKQTAVKTAQDQEQADRDQLAKLQQQLADYQNAPVLVQAAQDKLAQAQQDLATKQTALKDAQNNLATKQTALKEAQDNFDQAQAKLDTAQANKDQTDQELAAAIEAAKTNAEKYGDQVVVNPVSVTEGAKELPELTLANPQALPVARNTMALFTRVAQSLTALPYGTTVAWNDATKALADMQKAGQYTEQALVTFPDGTTKVVDFKLTVTAVAKETTPSQPNTSHHQDNIEPLDGITDAQKASFAGYHVLDGRVVDANGQPVAGWTIRQGIIYNAEGVAVAKVGTPMATPTKAETTLKRTTTLPQTGENESSWLSALGLTVLGTVSALGATLGLRKQN